MLYYCVGAFLFTNFNLSTVVAELLFIWMENEKKG